MDYLDRGKQIRHDIMLYVGYTLIGVAIVIATIVLLYQSYGFGLGKNGTVIQNGLTFFSSHPNPARIYINGKLNPSATNTRLQLPEGIYRVTLARSGYQDWQRTIELDGGSVEHYDYPFLIPTNLDTNKLDPAYAAPPTLMTQSPDRRWLVVGHPGSMTDFDVYDLKNPTKAPLSGSLPANILTKGSDESWQQAQWADDNQHVVLQHNFDGKYEFVLFDRVHPELSVNLNQNLSVNPAKLTLKNRKFDQYYSWEAAGGVQALTLKSSAKSALLQHVLAYQSYGNDTLLYFTATDAPAGQVWLKMRVGDKTTSLRSFPASPAYVLDLTEYSGTMYVAAGASSSNKVYIYKDPLGQLAQQPNQAIVPSQVLHVNQPNYVSFSDNAQFIVAENGPYFGVYDIENDKGYNYTAAPPDAPQPHARWMDGDRLFYVANGKLLEFDYDHTNPHTLVAASSQYMAAFAPDYKYAYTLAPEATGYRLNQTWLLALQDR